jgi:hypothetical protein
MISKQVNINLNFLYSYFRILWFNIEILALATALQFEIKPLHAQLWFYKTRVCGVVLLTSLCMEAKKKKKYAVKSDSQIVLKGN